MIKDFNIKPLFEDQVHERHQFTLTFEGNNYQGILQDGKIQWFHPQPKLKLDDLQVLESKVYDLIMNHEYQELEVKPLFEDQVHERPQFSLTFERNNYQGILQDGEIQWFHPQPQNNLDKEDLQVLESKVYKTLNDK